MGQDLNHIDLVGRLTKDAEIRYTATGTAVLSISLAVGRREKKGDEWTDAVSYFDVTSFGEGVHKYLLKGTQIAVSGSLVQERWEKDGQKHSRVKIVANAVQLLGSKKDDQGGGQREGSAPASRTAQQRPAADDFDPSAYESDIPF